MSELTMQCCQILHSKFMERHNCDLILIKLVISTIGKHLMVRDNLLISP